jgi:hypothetical protein
MALKLPGAPCNDCAVLNSFSKSSCVFAFPVSVDAPELKPRMKVSCAIALPIVAAATASAVVKRMSAVRFEGVTVVEDRRKSKLGKRTRKGSLSTSTVVSMSEITQ